MNIKSRKTRSLRFLKRGVLCAALAAAGMASTVVQAQPEEPLTRADELTNIGVSFGAGTSDNVLRREGAEESATYSTLGATLDVVRAGPRFNASAAGDVQFRSYSADGLDAERIGIVQGELEAFIVPERFSWFVSGRGGQGRTDPFGIETPQNRENIDIFETGPTVRLPVGERTNIELSAVAGTRLFEVSSELESDTSTVQAAVYRALSPTTDFGVVVSSRTVEYDNSAFDNDVERGYFTYVRRLATGSASLSLGSNRAEFIGQTETGPYIAADWTRRVGARSSITFNATNQLIDATDNVDYDSLVIYTGGVPGAPGGVTQSLLLTQDIYDSTDFGIAFDMTGLRTNFRVGMLFGQAEYMNRTALDNDRTRFTLTGVRNMTTRMDFGIDVDYTNRDFTNRPQEDKDTFVNMWVERDFAGPFSGRVGFGRNSRSGTDTARFDENIWTLSLLYDIRSSGAELPADRNRNRLTP